LPAPDRARSDDDDRVAEPDLRHLDAVEGARERVGDGGEVGGEVVGKGDEVLDGDRWHGRVLRVRAGVRVVSVQEVLVAQVLETVHAEAAAPARENGA